jgi:hypothetical protein
MPMSGMSSSTLLSSLYGLMVADLASRSRILPGTESPLRNCKPGDLDWVIIRENSEGEYAGHGGRSHRGLDHEIGTGAFLLDPPIRRLSSASPGQESCWSLTDRSDNLHPAWNPPDRSIRLSSCSIPSSKDVDLCHQVKRHAKRYGTVGRGNHRSVQRVPRRGMFLPYGLGWPPDTRQRSTAHFRKWTTCSLMP